MIKLLILSVLIMMVLIPIRASRLKNPGRAFRRAAVGVLVFNIFYWVAVQFLYFDLYLGKSPAELLSKTVHD